MSKWKRIVCGLLATITVCGAPATLAQARPEVTPATVVPAGNSVDVQAISAARAKLKGWGYSVSTDQQFVRAVVHFQKANRLPRTGTLDPATLKVMGISSGGLPTNLKCPQYADELQAVGLPVAYFDRVMFRESGCNPNAYNGRGKDESLGLLQINTKGYLWPEIMRRCGIKVRTALYNAGVNIACAAKLYQAYGRTPWGG